MPLQADSPEMRAGKMKERHFCDTHVRAGKMKERHFCDTHALDPAKPT